jgi:uncharacterized membrane protein
LAREAGPHGVVDRPVDGTVRSGIHRILVAVVVVLALGTTVTMALLASRPAPAPTTEPAPPPLVDGTVVEVTPVPVGEAEAEAGFLPPGAIEVDLRVRLDGTGEEVQVLRVLDDTGDTYQPGLKVRLEPFEGEEGERLYSVVDLQRGRPLLILAGLFVVAVLAFGRFQGLRALIGLALSAIVVVAFLIPAILAGQDPVVIALTSAFAIMVLTLYLSHGASPKTTAAVVGTALTLLLTGALALIFVRATNLTGLASEEAQFANFAAGGLSLRGLLLAGVILGALGVLDDVTVSQASLVFELARSDRRVTFSSLVRRALNVGRDHVAATVNTLFLAYAGASLPLLILFATGADSVPTVLTSEIVAIEVVRTFVGSLGLIAAVPLTTVLASALALGEREPEIAPSTVPALLAGEPERFAASGAPLEAAAAVGGRSRRLQTVASVAEPVAPRRRSDRPPASPAPAGAEEPLALPRLRSLPATEPSSTGERGRRPPGPPGRSTEPATRPRPPAGERVRRQSEPDPSVLPKRAGRTPAEGQAPAVGKEEPRLRPRADRRADRQPTARGDAAPTPSRLSPEAPRQPAEPPQPLRPATTESEEPAPARLRRTRTRQRPDQTKEAGASAASGRPEEDQAPEPRRRQIRPRPEPRPEPVVPPAPPVEPPALTEPSDTGLRRRSQRPPAPAAPPDSTRAARRSSRPVRRTAADAEADEAEKWFRELRNPYGRKDPEQ